MEAYGAFHCWYNTRCALVWNGARLTVRRIPIYMVYKGSAPRAADAARYARARQGTMQLKTYVKGAERRDP